ncbi:universal stress protein [Haloferax larsenii]|uniref:Universal stress protein family protein n=1 Tax=Haloferax larsenii TaxID=302484 RepID=A0A1H7HES4_HALLR|nr:universal stress protein [Haloferax larsenii]SEK48734.1 Universal stress protein family protein [Haloferax larsenii]
MYIVAYNGSQLSNAALHRAATYAKQTGDDVLAVAVVPEDAEYAVEQGWIPSKDDFDRGDIVSELHRTAVKIAPGASFRSLAAGRFPAPGEIVGKLKRVAHNEDADVVFVGSENAGRVVTPLASVGGNVASGKTYDVHIVRHAPPNVRERLPKSDFYFTD